MFRETCVEPCCPLSPCDQLRDLGPVTLCLRVLASSLLGGGVGLGDLQAPFLSLGRVQWRS